MQLVVTGSIGPVLGEVEVPTSKYHVHRALVLASLAPGRSVISGVSTTRQAEWTVGVLRALGTRIRIDGDSYVVNGGPYHATDVDDHGVHGGEGLLNVGSSGTTLYFMTGLAALADRPMTLTGMRYFRRRPIRALLDALSELGVESESAAGCPPITVQPRRPRGGDVHLPGTLSQWLSGLLLVAPFAERETRIHIAGPLNEQPYVELTVRMMRHFGLLVEHDDDWLNYRIPPEQEAVPADIVLPSDIGSAAFGVAAAALHRSDVLFRGLRATTAAQTDHPEAHFLDLAGQMGVSLDLDPATGFVRVRHDGSPLSAIDVDCTPIPDLVPVLATMASAADGVSRLRNVGHVRLKESDRVAAMLQLNRMGGRAEQSRTELRVTGTRRLHGAALSSFNDHRVLMSLAVAATRAEGSSTLTYPRAYRVSYPTFLTAMESVGLDMRVAAAEQRMAAATAESRAEPAAQPAVDDGPLVLPSLVRRLATERPDEDAVVEVGGRGAVATSWQELQREADQVSALLLESGVERGEPVALQLPNWREFIAITLGILQIGAVATPVMPVFGPRETAMTLSRSKARVVFTVNVFRHRRPALELLQAAGEARSAGRRLALEHVVVLRAEERDAHPLPTTAIPPIPEGAAEAAAAADWTWRYYDAALAAVEPDLPSILSRTPEPGDVCQLLFTSGTTGEPKGVQQTHGVLAVATSLEVAHLGLGGSDRIFVPSPIAHQTGFLYGMLLAWRLGVAAVVQPVWDAQVALEQAFAAAGATFVQAATPFLKDLVALVEERGTPPESLRIFVATGAAVPRALAQHATDVLGAAVLGAFGTTETCLVTLSAPADRPEDAWGSDGRSLPRIRVRIVDDEGLEVTAGEEGNFELSSPTVFAGYLDRPDLSEDVFTADGWYRTGDLARIDDRGFLHVTGRVKDVVNRGGEKIPVVEIENLLYQHPRVVDVAIVGMPDERLGERACAFIVPATADAPLAFDEMQRYLEQAGVSRYYWPERLEYLDALPRNAVGKVQKTVLRQQAATLGRQ